MFLEMQRTYAAGFIAILLFTGLHAAPHAGQAVVPATKRVALIIGNSQYQELGTLRNGVSDATAIDDVLKTLGFKTQLVLDASSDRTRRALRQFAGDSADADVALVFYAGHGAQVNGSNYLLPVDIEVPRFASDLALDGLKVDDLVNALRARTIVLFLDACRDNPVLFKNLPIGRGATSAGLAPATTLNANAMNGGLFIAYATDAGAVAADGTGAHSPFTDALLRHLPKSISLDDMFSLVTREVRLTTNNAQRPYKYASLDSIVCLTGTCASSQPDLPSGVLEAVRRSEADDFRSALDANNATALTTFLDAYPESLRRAEVVRERSRLRRQPFTEGTVINANNAGDRWFAQWSSIQVSGDRVTFLTKTDDDRLEPGGYSLDRVVYDCTRPDSDGILSEYERFGASNNMLERRKLADWTVIDLSAAIAFVKGSVGESYHDIACSDQLRAPFIDKADLIDKTMVPIYIGDLYVGDPKVGVLGEVFYLPNRLATIADPGGTPRNLRTVVTLERLTKPASVATFHGVSIDPKKDAAYVFRAVLQLIDCELSQEVWAASEFYGADLQLVAKVTTLPVSFVSINKSGASAAMFHDIPKNGTSAAVKASVCTQAANQ